MTGKQKWKLMAIILYFYIGIFSLVIDLKAGNTRYLLYNMLFLVSINLTFQIIEKKSKN